MAKLMVLTGPSGMGIGEIAAALFARRPQLRAVTPVTARKRKEGEKDGEGFYFYDLEGWNALKESGDLLECTEFAGNDYGSSRRLVSRELESGHDVLLNLPAERAEQVKRNMPEALCVFLEPSPAELEKRCWAVSRSALECSVRLQEAERARARSGFCDLRVVLDDPDAAVETLLALF